MSKKKAIKAVLLTIFHLFYVFRKKRVSGYTKQDGTRVSSYARRQEYRSGQKISGIKGESLVFSFFAITFGFIWNKINLLFNRSTDPKVFRAKIKKFKPKGDVYASINKWINENQSLKELSAEHEHIYNAGLGEILFKAFRKNPKMLEEASGEDARDVFFHISSLWDEEDFSDAIPQGEVREKLLNKEELIA